MNELSTQALSQWDLTDASAQERLEFVEEIGHEIYQAILVRSLDILSVDEESALDALLDKNETTPQDVLMFLQSKIPTFSLLVREEIAKVKESAFA